MLIVCAILLIGLLLIIRSRTKGKRIRTMILFLVVLLISVPIIIVVIEELFKVRIDLPNFNNETKIIELGKYGPFPIKTGNEYSYNILIKNPPENIDSLKKIMASYFLEKSAYLDSVDNGSYLGMVDFYKYTPKTAYFIKNNEDHNNWTLNTLNMHTEARIGFVLSHSPCKCDSTKFKDIMDVRDRSGFMKRDTLRWECDGMTINNWAKYK